MLKYFDYICKACGHEFEALVDGYDDKPSCVQCEALNTERLPSAAAGYKMYGSNSSSVRPRHAGSFKRQSKK